MEDYCQYFLSMSICRVVNQSFFSFQKTWDGAELHTEWKAPTRAGGCINNKETFLNNPQVTDSYLKRKKSTILLKFLCL